MFVLTRVIEAPDFCYASLFWFVQTWRLEAAILLTTTACILIIGAIVIFARLHQGASVGHVERATASRMVYYMILGAILNVSSHDESLSYFEVWLANKETLGLNGSLFLQHLVSKSNGLDDPAIGFEHGIFGGEQRVGNHVWRSLSFSSLPQDAKDWAAWTYRAWWPAGKVC